MAVKICDVSSKEVLKNLFYRQFFAFTIYRCVILDFIISNCVGISQLKERVK